jgi:hypothetical protein
MNKKILLAVALMMAMGFGAGRVHVDNWSNDTDVSWYAAGPSVYSVGMVRELAGLAKLVNEGNTFAGKTILLTANVELSAKTWAPAGRLYRVVDAGM